MSNSTKEKDPKDIITGDIKSIEMVLPIFPIQSNFDTEFPELTAYSFKLDYSKLNGRRVIDLDVTETRNSIRKGDGDNARRYVAGEVGTVISSSTSSAQVLFDNGVRKDLNPYNLYWFPSSLESIDREIKAYEKRIVFLKLRQEFMKYNKIEHLNELSFVREILVKNIKEPEDLGKIFNLVLNLIKGIKEIT